MAEEGDAKPPASDSSPEEGLFYLIIKEIFTSPLNLFLLSVCVLLLYKIFKSSRKETEKPPEPSHPKLPKQDITLEQLKQHDGRDMNTSLCVAVNGKVFDVRKGRKHYGPGGSYSAFAGRDATRALSTFNIENVKDEYDDLSDLSTVQMDSVREWEMQFTEKYDYVGRLLKPGEQPGDYSEDEENKDSKETKDNSVLTNNTSKQAPVQDDKSEVDKKLD